MREELERRPLVIAFLGLVIGSASFVSLISIIFVVPLIFLLKGFSSRATALACCLLGWGLYPRLVTERVDEETFLQAEVDVLTMPVLVGELRRTVVQSGSSRYLLALEPGSNVVLGDRLAVRADVLPLREGQYAQRGAIGVLRPIAEPVVVDEGSPLWRAGLWVSRSFASMTSAFVSPKTASLLDAMCFNMTGEVDDSFMDAMSRTGTTHIISTSGLHLVLVAYALALCLSRLPVPRGVMLGLLFGLLMVYAAAAGFRPPVVRAVMMTVAFLTAYAWRRGPDGLSSLALAGSLSLLFAPELVGDIGFQLSMVAVASLVMFARLEVTETAHRFVRVGLQYGWASVVVSLATAPLIAYHFGAVSLVSVPANLLVLPVLSFVIGGALGAWLTWLIAPGLGEFLLRWGVEPLTGWVAQVIESVGSLPMAIVTVPEFSPYWIVACFAAMVFLWRPVVRTA